MVLKVAQNTLNILSLNCQSVKVSQFSNLLVARQKVGIYSVWILLQDVLFLFIVFVVLLLFSFYIY